MAEQITNLINDNGRPAANQIVKTTDSEIKLISYGSDVCSVQRGTGKVTLGCKWGYSNTTRKHLYIFLRQQGHSVNSRKDIESLLDNGVFSYDPSMQ